MRTASSSVLDAPPPVEAAAAIGGRLRDIARATEIESAAVFHFAGTRHAVDEHQPPVNTALMTSVVPGDPPLVSRLAETLYHRCYCSRFDTSVRDSASAAEWTAADAARFQRELAEANTGQETWDLGWRVREALPGGQVVGVKGDSSRTFQPGEYLTAGTLSGLPAPGQPLRVFVLRDSWVAQTGFYFALGTTVADAEDDRNLVRLYWNVRATGSASLVRALTRTLNRYAIPFKYKCQVHAPSYARIDGSVLFIARRHFHVAADVLRGVYDTVLPHLDDDVPLFTLQLAPGLSVAEDPGTGESFGLNRMRLVALGLWSSRGVATDVDSKARAIGVAFHTAGLSLDAPHLRAGSRSVYHFPA